MRAADTVPTGGRLEELSVVEGLRLLRRAVGYLALSAVVLVLVLAAVSALSNRGLPTRSSVVDRLADGEKARLSEALHLRKALGKSIWPGWEQADVPVVLYNEQYAFLIGYPDPPPGWIKIPGGGLKGGPWETVPGELVDGAAYSRQLLPRGVTPEAFTVRVGTRWAASAPTFEWLLIGLTRKLRGELPGFLAPVFPYRLAQRLFIGGSDGYISLVLHEAFHAYQGTVAPDRVAAAERATASEREYERRGKELRASWQGEMDLLRRCALATSQDEARPLARQFLAHRRERRLGQRMVDRLIDYERQREWLEGLAKYVELESWRQAAKTPGYRPLSVLAGDPDFAGYAGFDGKWSRELSQMNRSAGGEDVRFYYSGMAQAVVLDRLIPGWKARVLTGGVWLEALVAEAAGSAP